LRHQRLKSHRAGSQKGCPARALSIVNEHEQELQAPFKTGSATPRYQ
jgi:hypothetical protein